MSLGGSRSRSENRSSTTSVVNQDIFGLTTGNVSDNAIVAGGDVSRETFVDASDRSQTNIDASDRSSTDIDVDASSYTEGSTFVSADPEVIGRALTAIENIGEDAFGMGSEALQTNRQVSEAALASNTEVSRRAAQSVEFGIGKAADALEDFGQLSYDVVKDASSLARDVIQGQNQFTGSVLKQQSDQTNKILTANKTETAQGFDRLTETLVTLAGVGAAALVFSRMK